MVIHDELPDAAREELSRFPNVQFHQAGAALQTRLAEVASRDPHLARKTRHFLALDAFNLPHFDRILHLDSDLLCTGDAADLFTHDGGLLACPDQAYFWGLVRDRTSYEPRDPATAASGSSFPVAFNTGMLVISPARLGPNIYHELLARVSMEALSPISTGHTVSHVLNEQFRGAWTQLPEKYNYLISKGMTRYVRPRAALRDAVFVHYLGRPKPWNDAGPVTIVSDDHEQALSLWNDARHAARITSRDTD